MSGGNGHGTRHWGTPHDVSLFLVGLALLAEEAVYRSTEEWTWERVPFIGAALMLMAVPGVRALLESIGLTLLGRRDGKEGH